MQEQKNNFVQKGQLFQQQLFTFIKNNQNFKCSQNNQAFHICKSQTCQNPGLMCNKYSCQCQKNHFKCSHLFLERIIDGIFKKKQQIPKEINKCYQQLIQKINSMIDQLSLLRNQIETKRQYYLVTQNQIKFMEFVRDKEFQSIKGKMINQIQIDLNENQKENLKQKDQLIKKSVDIEKQSLDKIRQLINIKIKSKLNTKLRFFLSDSILVQSIEDKNLICKWLCEAKNKENLLLQSKLLFRASQHNFKASQFYNKCTNFVNTIVLCKNQYDKIIGGYSPQAWFNTLNNTSKNDVTKSAFLFSLNLKQRFKCLTSSQSIYSNKGWGPLFGCGYDFAISDDSNQNSKSYCNFPYTYGLTEDNKNKYTNNQQLQKLMHGSLDSMYFKVKQYQVHQIIGLQN